MNETDYQDHPLAATSSSGRTAATTTLTTPDDDEMIDITPHSSPGDGSHHLNTYSRGSTADNSDMERERGDYNSHHNHPHHSNNSQHHQRIHQHVPTHSAFGDSMEGKKCSYVYFLFYLHFFVCVHYYY